MPVAGDVLIMLLEGPAEEVATLGIGHEVEVFGGERIQRCTKRGLAWIGNRAGRQPPVLVGVVRRRVMEEVAVQFASVSAREGQGIRDRGIALQRLADAQPVFEHARYVRALFRARRLALDQRSERDDVLNIAVRRTAREGQGQPLLPKFFHHRRGHVFS